MYDLEDEYEPDITKCPKCGGEADNGFDRCVPPSPYWCSRCEMEDNFLYIDFSDATYMVPVKIIADNYAKYWEKHPRGGTYEEEYDSFIRSGDSGIIDWASSNMDWSNVKAHAKKVEPPKYKTNYNLEWLNSDKYIAG